MINIDYIAGEKFQGLAEVAGIPNLIYCKADDANALLMNPPHMEFVLITHNGDSNITDCPKRPHDADARLIPKNLKMWFGQNVNVKHDRIQSIPIGLENSEWFVEIDKRKLITEAMLRTDAGYENMVYANFNINTNKLDRQYAYDCVKNYKWCTPDMCVNGTDFKKYVNSIRNHAFVLCPDGNGIDTHRLWETLYVGSIPIVKRSINTRFYEDLPILMVNDWSEVKDTIFSIKPGEFKNRKWNLDKLWFQYWYDLIIKTCLNCEK